MPTVAEAAEAHSYRATPTAWGEHLLAAAIAADSPGAGPRQALARHQGVTGAESASAVARDVRIMQTALQMVFAEMNTNYRQAGPSKRVPLWRKMSAEESNRIGWRRDSGNQSLHIGGAV